MAKKRCRGKYCGRRFKGFGVSAPGEARTAFAPLLSAVKQARWRECGDALENLGRAKALLGSLRHRPKVASAIKFVETACPKSRVVAVRADVATELRLAPGTELPSTWAASNAALMQGRLRVPGQRRIWDKKGHRYVWRAPSKAVMRKYRALLERQQLVELSHRRAGGRPKRTYTLPIRRRRGEVIDAQRRHGRPSKASKAALALKAAFKKQQTRRTYRSEKYAPEKDY